MRLLGRLEGIPLAPDTVEIPISTLQIGPSSVPPELTIIHMGPSSAPSGLPMTIITPL